MNKLFTTLMLSLLFSTSAFAYTYHIKISPLWGEVYNKFSSGNVSAFFTTAGESTVKLYESQINDIDDNQHIFDWQTSLPWDSSSLFYPREYGHVYDMSGSGAVEFLRLSTYNHEIADFQIRLVCSKSRTQDRNFYFYKMANCKIDKVYGIPAGKIPLQLVLNSQNKSVKYKISSYDSTITHYFSSTGALSQTQIISRDRNEVHYIMWKAKNSSELKYQGAGAYAFYKATLGSRTSYSSYNYTKRLNEQFELNLECANARVERDWTRPGIKAYIYYMQDSTNCLAIGFKL